MAAARHIAVINDDAPFLDLMADLLGDEGDRITLHHGGPVVYPALRRDAPDLVVLDIRMPSRPACWELLQVIRLDCALARAPVIVCWGDIRFLRERDDHLREKGWDTLVKPFEIAEMLRKITVGLGAASAA